MSQFSLVTGFFEREKIFYTYSGHNSNVKNSRDILSIESVQDFLENPNVKNATKLWSLSKRTGLIVQCGSFTYLMDSLTNFLPAFVPKICKRVANSRKYWDCSGPKIQNRTQRFDEKKTAFFEFHQRAVWTEIFALHINLEAELLKKSKSLLYLL